MASVSVGSVSVDVVPSVKDFASRMRREMLPQATELGREVGKKIQQGIEKEVKPVSIRVNMGTAVTRLERLKKLIKEIDGQTAKAQVEVDIGGSLVELRALATLMNRLNGRRIDVHINTQVAQAQAQIALLQNRLRALENRKTISINADVAGALFSISTLRAALIGLGVLSLPAIAGVGAGIAGLVGPLTAAGVGFGGMAAVAVPAIMRIREAQQQQAQATRAAAGAAGQAQARAFALANAQQQLAAAIRNAGYAHKQALEQVRQAQQQLTQAQVAAAAAERDLAAARAQARRSLEDMRMQLVSASLAVQEQQLAIQESQMRWQELARAASAAAARVTAAQQDLAAAQAAQEQVLADPAATDAAKAQAAANVSAAKAAVKAAEDKKKAADLEAKQAEVNHKQAVQRLKEQQLQLKRLRADEAAASKAGVEGSDQVRSARERLAQANQRITDAERALAAARANVARVDQQSADQIASARRALAQASMQAASSTAAMAGPMIRLTALEKQLAAAWEGLTDAFDDWNRALQPAVIPVLIKGITLLRNTLPLLTPAVQGAAIGIGYLLDRANAAAQSPFWTQFSTWVGQAATPAIIGLGTLLGNLLKGLAGLAQSFGPIGFTFLQVLNNIAERFAAFMTGLANNPAFQRFTQQFVAAGPLITGTFLSLGNLIGSFFSALAPAMQPILTFISTLANTLASVLKQAGPAIASVFSALGQGLSAVLVALAPAVTQLVNALAPLLVQLINGLRPILISLVPVLSQVISALAPVISALLSGLQPAIQSLVPVIGVLVGALGRILLALAPILPILGKFIADLVSGLLPILQPIIDLLAEALSQVAGALVQTLQQSLPAIQQIVLAVATLLPALMPLIPLWVEWLTTLMPLVPALLQLAAALIVLLVPVLRFLITVLMRVWTTIGGLILPVFRFMVTVVTWAAGILTAIFNGIGVAARLLGRIAMWLWTKAIQPAFRFIGTLAKWLYTIVAITVIAPLVIQFKILAAVATWLWKKIFQPVWRGIVAAFSWAWGKIRPVLGWLGDKVRQIWREYIKPAFDAIADRVGKLAPHFRNAVDAIGRAWNKLKAAAKGPVSFVVNTVFNSGIVKLWNAVAKLVPGTAKLTPIKGFAAGGLVGPGQYGVLPGYAPGKDTMLAAVSPGEGWIRPDATRALGADWIHGINRAAVTGGSAGAARWLAENGGLRFGLGGIVGGFLKSAKNLFTEGLVKTARKTLNPLVGLAERSIGGTPFGDLAVSMTRGLAGKILKAFGPLEGKIGGDGRKVVKVAEKYVGLSGNPNKFTRAWGLDGYPWCGMFVGEVFKEAGAKKALKRVSWPPLVSSYRTLPKVSRSAAKPGDVALYRGDSGHINIFTGRGAVTIGGNESNAVRRQSGYINSASSIRRPAFALGGVVPKLLAQDLRENNRRTTPLPTQILRAIAGQPLLFDDGGWLPVGASLVYNKTGSPEPVLTDAQWARISESTSGGDGGVHYHGHFDGLTKAAYESQFRTAMQAEAVLAARRDRTGRRR